MYTRLCSQVILHAHLVCHNKLASTIPRPFLPSFYSNSPQLETHAGCFRTIRPKQPENRLCLQWNIYASQFNEREKRSQPSRMTEWKQFIEAPMQLQSNKKNSAHSFDNDIERNNNTAATVKYIHTFVINKQ